VIKALLGWLRRGSPASEPQVFHSQVRLISNTELTAADIPGEDDSWDHGIHKFAASFNGYQHWGSPAKCFEVGSLAQTKNLRDLTLTELRTALFCQFRSTHHSGELGDEDLPRAQAILAEIRDRVMRRALD
jgi:hypothetical protein